MRIFKIASLINCKLTNTSPSHQNLLLVNIIFSIAKDKSCRNTIFGDIGHYKNLFEKEHARKKELENMISNTLKRHNGHRLVLLDDNQYVIIYPKKEMIRLGSTYSHALAFWYRYWKQQNKNKLKRVPHEKNN
jgi:hypothetical protein